MDLTFQTHWSSSLMWWQGMNFSLQNGQDNVGWDTWLLLSPATPPSMPAEFQTWASLPLKLCHVKGMDEESWNIHLSVTTPGSFSRCWEPHSKALWHVTGRENLVSLHSCRKRPFPVSLKVGNKSPHVKNATSAPGEQKAFLLPEGGLWDWGDCINKFPYFFINLLSQPQIP